MRVCKLHGMVPAAVLTAPMCTHVALLVLQHGLRDRERGLRPGNEGGAGRKHHRRCARVGLGFKNIPKGSLLFFAQCWLVSRIARAYCQCMSLPQMIHPCLCANPGAYQIRLRNTPSSRLSYPCDCRTHVTLQRLLQRWRSSVVLWCMCQGVYTPLTNACPCFIMHDCRYSVGAKVVEVKEESQKQRARTVRLASVQLLNLKCACTVVHTAVSGRGTW